MKGKRFFRFLWAVCVLCIVVSAFSACSSDTPQLETSSDGNHVNLSNDENIKIYGPKPTSDASPDNSGNEKPNLTPKMNDAHITPDLDSVKLRKASKGITETSSEEILIDTLEAYANPNGNEYDAISVLGRFRYAQDDGSLYTRFKSSSDYWHGVIEKSVGPKCVVDISIKSKTPVSLSDPKVSDWNTANEKKAEAFSNVKCLISTNYSSKTLTLSIDIVKIDGNWYLANTSVINKLQSVITEDIYK